MDEFISSKRSLQSLFGPDLFGPESMRVYSSCQLYTTHKAQAIHNQLHPIASCHFQSIVETIKGFMKKKKKCGFCHHWIGSLAIKKKVGGD